MEDNKLKRWNLSVILRVRSLASFWSTRNTRTFKTKNFYFRSAYPDLLSMQKRRPGDIVPLSIDLVQSDFSKSTSVKKVEEYKIEQKKRFLVSNFDLAICVLYNIRHDFADSMIFIVSV